MGVRSRRIIERGIMQPLLADGTDRSLVEAVAEVFMKQLFQESPKRKKAAGAEAAAEARGIPVAFGKYADLDGIRRADWKEAGEATASIRELTAGLLKAIREGQPLGELQARLARENAKLRRLEAAIEGRIPTHALKSGEETHPLVLANLMGALLENAGVPFEASQVEPIARSGNEFEAEYDRLQASYDEGTPAFAKVVDELELKRQFVRKLQGVLTRGRRRYWPAPRWRTARRTPSRPSAWWTPSCGPCPASRTSARCFAPRGRGCTGSARGSGPSWKAPSRPGSRPSIPACGPSPGRIP